MIKGGEGWSDYVDRIGLFFFFVACAGVSLIVLAFNWVCWLNQCCCCDFLHNPVNKRIAWWMSFSFLCGMLACCISGCVSVNRFGFAIEGAWCAFDRLYYDSLHGQLKTTEPKWKGFENANKILFNLETFIRGIASKKNSLDNSMFIFTDFSTCISEEEDDDEDTISQPNIDKTYEYINKYVKIISSLEYLKKSKVTDSKAITKLKETFNKDNQTEFQIIKTNLLEDGCFYYGRVLIGCMKVLAMVYFCLFIITITLAGVSMMFYACLKRQGYLITIMHVLWNIIRFFMFSFFIFGAAYGIFFLALRDSIAVVQGLFDTEGFLLDPKKNLFPAADNNQFLIQCLKNPDYNFIDGLGDEKLKTALEDFSFNYKKLTELLEGDEFSSLSSEQCIKKIQKKILEFNNNKPLCDSSNLNCTNLPELSVQKGGLFGSLNCGFLQTDLNLIYRALYDASVESRILAACSLCAAFFGAISVYFYLLVLHHYNNEIFFDGDKSIFTGIDGFGRGYKTKSHNKDPAYKKRKLRAEIELPSINDEEEE